MHSLNCPPCTYHSHILNLAAWTSTRVYKNCVRPQVHSPQCPASSINWNRCTGSTDHDMHIILLKTLSGFNNFYFRSFLSLCNKPQIIYFPRNKFSLLLKWSKQPNKDYCSLTISCMKKKCFVCSVKLPPSCCLKYMPEVFVLGEERHGNEVLSVIFSSMFMIL